ncbi:MAG: aldo/keto reductase [Pirellulales bacterium]|nr:aldo/keto reductase [Pirellulales bacterium]
MQSQLGDVELVVPRIIVGCWQLARGHSLNSEAGQDEQLDLLNRYFDVGFRTFDCADIYTGVEELLGIFRRGLRAREDTVSGDLRIHTKFVPDRDQLANISRAYVERIVDRSLARLQTERLDLVQFHWWDFDIPGYVETAQHLMDLVATGKIAAVGLTNFDVRHAAEIIEAGIPLISNQVQWSLLDQRPAKHYSSFADQNGLLTFCYGGLAGGFLGDRYLDSPELAESFSNRSLIKYKLIIDEVGGWDVYQALLRALREVADDHQASIASITLAWLLHQPAVSSVIVGAGSTRTDHPSRHMPELLRTLQLELSESDMLHIDKALRRLRPVPGVIYEQERKKPGPHAAIMRYNLNAAASD